MLERAVVGKRVAEIRKINGLKQKELAEYLQVDQSFVSRCEKDERIFSIDMLEKIADLFGCAMDCLFNEEKLEPFVFAFRTTGMTLADLETIAVINKIAKNLAFMDSLLKEE